jgi:D-threo-aldose 1-dehydrogenase
MKHTEIGTTGIKIPPIIFGTSALGNLYRALDFKTKLEIVGNCFEYMEAPVVFDSAGKYGAGLALEVLGKCLQKLDIKTQDIIISNKLGWLRTTLNTPEPTFEPGVWKDIENDAVQHISYEGIIRCWEQGNKLLGKHKAQLVSIHDPDEYLNQATSPRERDQLFSNILDAYRALAELKAKGEARAIGIGAKDWKIIEEIESHVSFDWVMFANSMTILKHPPDLLNFMKRLANKKVAIINSAVFHAGFLTGGNFFDYKLIKPNTAENKALYKWRDDFNSVCKRFSISPAMACVSFAMTAPGVVSISLNTSNPARVRGNIESVVSQVPGDFWKEMVEKGLINSDYPFLNL